MFLPASSSLMKSKKKVYLAIALIIFFIILLISYLLYTPPLLDRRGYNIPGWIYNFFSYAYYSSRAEWLKNTGKDHAALQAAALAAWHRPFRTEELLGLKPDNLFILGQRYGALGLDNLAVKLFRAALSESIPGEEQYLEIISSLAILDDWSGAELGARRLIRVYPSSAGGKYWLGRTLLNLAQLDAAGPFLQSAYQIDPSLGDALYQLARIDEAYGREDSAVNKYEQVVSILSGHLGAWRDLERLYGKTGAEEKLGTARRMVRELTPPVSCRRNFNGRAVILGYALNRPKILTGDDITLDLYIRDWVPESLNLRISVRLRSVEFWGKVEKESRTFYLRSAGDVVKESLSWKNPWILYPGNYRLEVAVEEADANPLTDRKDYRALTTIELSPRWLPAHRRDRLVRRHFGATAYSLGKRTFLGPGSELALEFDEKKKIAALGVVSSAQCYASFPQGEEIARVIINTDDGEESEFPVRMGEETAKCWWELASPEKRRHKLAPVFRSWPVRHGEKEFQGHEYRAVFPIPCPSTISRIRVENVSQNAGFSIADIIIIPGEAESGLKP